MKAWTWAALMAGWALMALSYGQWYRIDPSAPWADGLMCLGTEVPAGAIDGVDVVPARCRYFPASTLAGALLGGMGALPSERRRAMEAQLRTKLIELPIDQMGLLVGRLSQGRMPEPGKAEVLAGATLGESGPVEVAGRKFSVVGVLQRSVALLAGSYVVPADPVLDPVFAPGDPSALRVALTQVKGGARRDRDRLKEIRARFPAEKFAMLMPSVRPPREGFLAYLSGISLFLLGGSGLLIGLYQMLARRATRPFLARVLGEIVRRPRLIWGAHLVYFGLYLAGAILIYELPEVQAFFVSAVRGEILSKGNGPLAIAGRAYGSGNILYAAAVTFLVNFFIGSFGSITLPSMIIPGCGVLMALFRATLWGMLLGPSEVTLSAAMLAHSGTLLLEGGGYILAAFFAILIPVYLVNPPVEDVKSSGAELSEELAVGSPLDPPALLPPPAPGGRLARAMRLNLKAQVLIAGVLAVAALYEAVEVILMATM